MTPTLGLVTIGQTPRPDYERGFSSHSPGVSTNLLGALDGVQESEINEMVKASSKYPLHARLANGSIVEMPLEALQPLVARKIDQLAATKPQLIVLLCTGGFSEFECQVPVLLPGKLVPAIVDNISRTKRIGVVTPIQSQVEAAEDKWRASGFSPHVVAAAPNRSEEIYQAASSLSDPDLVILDCMGHDEGYREEFARHCTSPVLLAQTLVSRIAAEILDGYTDTLPA